MLNTLWSLSPDFQKKASYAYAQSQREVRVTTLYQKPDSVDFVQELVQPLDDQIETGLMPLILIRVGLENPDLLSHFLPHISEINRGNVIPEQLLHVTDKIEERYKTNPGATIDENTRKGLLRKTDRILDGIIASISYFPSSFSIDFKAAARENGHFVPTKSDNERKLAEANFSSPLGFLQRTKSYFSYWIQSIEAPLNHVRVDNWSLAQVPDGLAEIERRLKERGPQLYAPQPAPAILH